MFSYRKGKHSLWGSTRDCSSGLLFTLVGYNLISSVCMVYTYMYKDTQGMCNHGDHVGVTHNMSEMVFTPSHSKGHTNCTM